MLVKASVPMGRPSVDPDTIADPEASDGVRGVPADGTPIGIPLSFLGPERTPEGEGGPKIEGMAW